MKTNVEPLEGNKVKLSVEVDEGEFEVALDEAFRRLAGEVNIKGFRRGKVPRRVLEAHLGPEVARSEALRTALPDYYSQAVRDHEVDVIASPDIDITAGQEEGPVSFDAVVEVRPVVSIGGYESLRVTLADPAPTSEEVDEQVDELRARFATLETVDRPADDGDHVTIDINGSQDGEALDGLTTTDYDYEVGSGAVVPELDENLRGAKAGDILEFDAPHPVEDQSPLSFRILVKEVQAKVLPEADDDFAAEASEFDTLAEFRADIEAHIRRIKLSQAQSALREKTAGALADLIDIELPDSLVAAETQNHLQELAMRAGAQGLQLEQLLAMTGKDPAELSEDLRSNAERSARIDLALRALAEAEAIEVTEEDLDREFSEAAVRLQRDPAEFRAEFERDGDLAAVRSDLGKRSALEWLLDQVEIVDEDGNPLERSAFEDPEGGDDPSASLPEVAGSSDRPAPADQDDDDEDDQDGVDSE